MWKCMGYLIIPSENTTSYDGLDFPKVEEHWYRSVRIGNPTGGVKRELMTHIWQGRHVDDHGAHFDIQQMAIDTSMSVCIYIYMCKHQIDILPYLYIYT